jgi:hypothetical protein
MIACISPQDGHVIAWIDLTGLLSSDQMIDAESVFNGIAYDPKHDRLFVTGKQWPTVFEIKVIQRTMTDKRHLSETTGEVRSPDFTFSNQFRLLTARLEERR